MQNLIYLAVLLFFAIWLLILGLIIRRVVRKSREKPERLAALQKAAGELNFTFRGAEIPFENLSGAADFDLFTKGNAGRHIYNLMTAAIGNLQVSLFDFVYLNRSSRNNSSFARAGSGGSYETWQTVVMIDFSNVRLPSFRLDLKSGNVLRGINHALGYEPNGIEFPAHPFFSEKYALLGGDELEFRRPDTNAAAHAHNGSQLRRLFSDAVLSFYENDLGLRTESSGNRLIFYRHRMKIPPDQLRRAVDEALTATNLFFAAANGNV